MPGASDALSDSRDDLVQAFTSLRDQFSGTSAPGVTIRAEFMFWADTTNDLLKQRDKDDAAWLTLWDTGEGPRYISTVRARTNKPTHLFFCAPFACTVKRVWLVSDTATVGSDASNNYAYQCHNRTASVTLGATAKKTSVEELTVHQRWLLTTDQNLDLAEGDVLDIVPTVSGSPTSLATADQILGIEFIRT